MRRLHAIFHNSWRVVFKNVTDLIHGREMCEVDLGKWWEDEDKVRLIHVLCDRAFASRRVVHISTHLSTWDTTPVSRGG